MTKNELDTLIKILLVISEGEEDRIMEFLNTPIPEWDGITPIDLVRMNRVKGLIDYLEREYLGVGEIDI